MNRSVYPSGHPSFDLSLDVFMAFAMHRSVYLSIDPFTRVSIDLAIQFHCAYPLLCFKKRRLQELPLRHFPSSTYGCTMRLGHKTDAKRRRYTDGSEKTPSFQRSNVNPGNNKATCCRLGSAARKDTRFIESGASKTDTCSCHDRWQSQNSLRCNTNSLGIACPACMHPLRGHDGKMA